VAFAQALSGSQVQDRIRVAIAHDHSLYTEGLLLILRQQEQLEVVGCATSGLEAIDMVGVVKPDVLLLDIKLPEMEGIEILPAIKQKSPATKTLMLTSSPTQDNLEDSVRLGAKGYLARNAGVSDLLKAVKAIHSGEMWLSRKLIARLFEKEVATNHDGGDRHPSMKTTLTKREQEILRLLTKGISNKEMAETLYISEKTVKTHLNSIFKKLKVARRLQAILCAIKAGIC
jgi:two-component system response regulator DegU